MIYIHKLINKLKNPNYWICCTSLQLDTIIKLLHFSKSNENVNSEKFIFWAIRVGKSISIYYSYFYSIILQNDTYF